jgi:hypothetical protein
MSFINQNNYDLGPNKPLIKREQDYVLNRKLVSIHSEDRDVTKYPNSNNFEIELPETLLNVQSLRLTDIVIPYNSYNYSNNIQNTKIAFKLIPYNNGRAEYAVLLANSTNNYISTITNGFYNYEQLSNELMGQMNQSVTDYLTSQGFTINYDSFKIKRNSVTGKMWIANDLDSFSLSFDLQITYDLSCGYPLIFNNPINWGLPFNLGFEKQNYTSITKTGDLKFFYDNDIWVTPNSSGNNTVHYIESPLMACNNNYNTIYMELEKYNTMDELVPFPSGTSNLYNNKYNGTVNAAFAKIPLKILINTYNFNNSQDDLENMSFYNPVIEKIKKLKFKFRYHDGLPVDFGNCTFNFTLQFNSFLNEIKRDYHLRVPDAYRI